jgi:hypothetical protein
LYCMLFCGYRYHPGRKAVCITVNMREKVGS